MTSRAEVLIGRMPQGRHVLLEIEMSDNRLSICGTIGHPASLRVGNGDSMGQNADTIRAALDSGELKPAAPWTRAEIGRVLDIWDRWHLNDMRAGCEHQRAGVAAYDGDPDAGTPWDQRPIDPDKPTNAYGLHFPAQRQSSWNMLGWIRPAEHPHGLLARPCPVCGYGYGTAWRSETIPADVRAELHALLSRS